MQAKVSYCLTPANAKQWETIFTDLCKPFEQPYITCINTQLNGTLEAMEPEVEADILFSYAVALMNSM